jgi:hypothetical protein
VRQRNYAKDTVAQKYPVGDLSPEEKRKIDGLTFDFRELTAEHIVYALSRAFGSLFHNIWISMEEIAGEDTARKMSYAMGVKYGFANYGDFLDARGLRQGSPSVMCEYQDKIHSVRGPIHANARFGQFDKEKCIITRNKCIYHQWHTEKTRKYHEEFYKGLYDGYKKADPALKDVENPRCLWKGDDGCTHIFRFR